MKNIQPGPNFTNDRTDYILLSFADALNTVIWGDEVLITRIWKTQFRVYSDAEKALIDKCEAEPSNIPHSELKKMLYGHPKHNGESSFCKSVQEHLQEHVGNRKLGHQNGKSVDESSIDEVKEHISFLGKEGRVNPRDRDWAGDWEKKKLIAELPPKVQLAQELKKAKLYGAPEGYKDWIAVTMPH